MLFLLSLVWGGSFFFIEIAVSEIPPFTLVLCRVAFGAILLLLLLRVLRIRVTITRRLVLDFLVLGAIANMVPFVLIVWGQQSIDSGLASILNATTSLWTVCLAHFFGDRLTPSKLGGVTLGFCGVVVLIGPDALSDLGGALTAQLAVVGASLSYAVAAIFAKARVRSVPPFAAAAGQLSAASLLILPIALLVDRPWTLPAPSFEAIAALSGLVVLSTVIAYGMFFRILASAGTNVVLVTFLVPVSAILLGTVFLGERLSFNALAGMVLISLGLAAIDGRMLKGVRMLFGRKGSDGMALSVSKASREKRA